MVPDGASGLGCYSPAVFSVLLGILGLSVMIIIHEFGHFVCAGREPRDAA